MKQGTDPGRRRRLGCDLGGEGADRDGLEFVACVDADAGALAEVQRVHGYPPTAASRT